MKKILLILLTLTLCLCVACANTAGGADDVPSEVVVNLATDTSLYKTFGRTYVNDEGLNMDFPAQGFEFEAECSGTVSIQYSGSVKTYFQVYVDGEAGLRICTKMGEDLTCAIAENLPEGKHVIRFVRDSDAARGAELMAIRSVTFTGKKSTVKATAEKPLYIEFIGDSITAGKYTSMEDVGTEGMHKATNSYAYLTAAALDADYSVIAKGGCGYFRIKTSPKTMNQLYPYYNGFLRNPQKYQTARKADVVVLALGTNDNETYVKESYNNGTVPFATYDEALNDMLSQIRGQHGEDVPIVLMYGMMNSVWEDNFKNAAKDERVHLVKVPQNREGGNDHPSVEGHKVFSQQLVDYLKTNVLK